MRVDPQTILDDWQHATQGELIEPPSYVRAAIEDLAREKAIEQQHWFDFTVDQAEKVVAAAAQLELKLPRLDERARVRHQVADYLERVVLPRTDSRTIHRIPAALRSCRQKQDFAMLPSGKMVVRWDSKAGLPLICPDDAREESMRISRRYVPAIMDEIAKGRSVHFAVLTIDNPAPGKLRMGVNKLFRKLRSITRACKRRERPFPIVGALAVLEAPLGRHRDWHPHLNVILICDGYLDYGELRQRWGCNAHFQRMRGTQPAIEGAIRELIKYSVRAVPEKSQERAGDDRPSVDVADGSPLTDRCQSSPQPPAMIEWTAGEFLEWWNAHRGLRRTRTFGCLYKVPKPEKVDTSGAVWIGSHVYDGTRFVQRSALLGSIPGDKSTPENIRKAIKEAWCKLLGPPGQVQRALHVAAIIKKHYGPVSLSV